MADKNDGKAVNTYGDENILPGMLSSPHIAYCAQKYRIIENYDESCLGPATYHMRLGGKVLTWEFGERVEYFLGENDNKEKNIRKKVILKPNSLTFITTIESFNLPKDIIARFNLKSKWVHQGILLGTGPIVDPELVANLLIPLHNFSNRNVEIEFNKKIISVEFTKTLNPDDQLSYDDKDFIYINNKSRIFDFDGYRKRIMDEKVESSVSSTFQEYDEKISTSKDRLRWFTISSFIAVLAAFIGLITLVITTQIFISSARNEVNEAKNVVAAYKEKIEDYKDISLNSEYIELQNKIQELRKITEIVRSEIKLDINKQNVDTQKLLEDYGDKIQQIELHLKKLESAQRLK